MVLFGTEAAVAGQPSWRHTTLEASPWHALLTACEAGETDDAALRSLESRLHRVHSRPGGLLAFTLEDTLRATLAAVSSTWLDGKAPPGSHWAALTVEALRILTQVARKQHNARKVRLACDHPALAPPQTHSRHLQVCSTFVQHALDCFVRAASAQSRQAGSTHEAELLQALHAGLFAPALAGGHAAAIASRDDASPTEPPAKRRKQADAATAAHGETAPSSSPQAALYAIVCSKCSSGACPVKRPRVFTADIAIACLRRRRVHGLASLAG
jgi:hypothetical protein